MRDTELPIRARKAGYKLIVSYDVPVYGHIKDKGHINHLDRYSFKLLMRYHFNVRSHVILKERFWFAMESASNIVYGLRFFAMDFKRIIVHFFGAFKSAIF